MPYYLVKATCPFCGVVKHLISVNKINRLACDDCLEQRDEIAEMILAVQLEED
jgi:hypothetical protein